MPIIRKVIRVGTSKAITIPKSWFEFFEKETGAKVTEVAVEVDRILTVQPIFSKGEGQNVSEDSPRRSKRV